MNKKSIKEMNSMAGGGVSGGTITAKVASAAVYPAGKKMKKKNGKKSSKPYKTAKLENKGEKILREAIRNLIFLSQVKYHEEQAKIGIQEQKLRYVIRHLLNEEKSDQIYLTTGENNAADFLNNIKSTTFDQLYAKLSSSEQQRLAFRATYLEKLKLYLDSLDQQHVILNPQDKPARPLAIEKPMDGNEASPEELETGAPTMEEPEPGAEEPAETEPTPVGGAPEEAGAELGTEEPPAAPEGGEEAPLQEVAAAPAANTGGGMNIVPDTSRLQKQIIATQLNRSDLHPTGVGQALKALQKDLPQIDDLYSQLTFKPLKLPSGELTSDREIFRKMLFGGPSADGSSVDGNLDINFDNKDKDVVTSDKPTAEPKPAEPTAVPTGTTPEAPTELAPQEPTLQ